MSIVPPHSLVLAGDVGVGGLLRAGFTLSEVFTAPVLSERIWARKRLPFSAARVESILDASAVAALDAGLRVVLLGDDDDRAERLVAHAERSGVPVVDMRNRRGWLETVAVVPTGNMASVEAWVRRRFTGVSVVGDVHADPRAVDAVERWTRVHRRYCVFLGDLVDHGPEPAYCLSVVAAMVQEGRASVVLGNHDVTFLGILDGRIRPYDDGRCRSAATVYAALDEEDRRTMRRDAATVYGSARVLLVLFGVHMAHARFEPWFPREGDGRLVSGRVVSRAVWGRGSGRSGTFESPCTVVTGHHPTPSGYPEIGRDSSGATWIRLDTGAGKGGAVSLADFVLVDGRLSLRCLWLATDGGGHSVDPDVEGDGGAIRRA